MICTFICVTFILYNIFIGLCMFYIKYLENMVICFENDLLLDKRQTVVVSDYNNMTRIIDNMERERRGHFKYYYDNISKYNNKIYFIKHLFFVRIYVYMTIHMCEYILSKVTELKT